MTGADVAANLGAGRGSGTEPDGKGVASPSEAPSEAHAASAKPPIKVTTNPRIRIIGPRLRLKVRRNRKPGPYATPNTALIRWSHKIQQTVVI